MNLTKTDKISEVLNHVKTWVPEMRITLACKILETLETSKTSKPPRKMLQNQVFGILKTNAPSPNDKECAKIIEEERLRKYE